MNHMTNLLRVAAVAAVLGLAACSKAPAPTPQFDSATAAVAAYAKFLQTYHGDLLINPTAPVETLKSPRTFLVAFTVTRAAWLTKPLRFPGDEETRAQNERITNAWTKLFCTTELVDVLKSQNIFMVSGQIVDGSGSKHSLAACMANFDAKPLNDPTRHLD